MVGSRVLIHAVVVVAVAAAAIGPLARAAAPQGPGAPVLVEVGKAMPDVTMSGLNGPDRRLSSYAGRPLVINVWASWCGPCRAEAASLERFAWSSAGQKYTFIGISTDDDRRAAERWLRQSNATLSHFIDHALVLETLLGATAIPLTVLLDEKGRVVGRFRGAREWDSPESVRLVERAFKEYRSGAQARK